MPYLEMAAAAKRNEVAQYYFDQVVTTLASSGRQRGLTSNNLDFLDTWLATHPSFRPWLERLITCQIEGWEQTLAHTDRDRKITQQRQRSEWIKYYREHLAAIRDGRAHPKILYDLAMAHEGLLHQAHGETPRERLEDFLDGDAGLIEAALAGFRHSLSRPDLPSVAEIVEINLKGKTPFICLPCLVGMNDLFRNNPSSVLEMSEAILSRLVAFRLTDHPNHDTPWFDEAIAERPSLVSEVLITYALPALRAGKDHVSMLHDLANDDKFSAVARIALPALLDGFPLRARTNQLRHALDPLLTGARRHLDNKTFISILRKKLARPSMDAAQHVYWLACGLLVLPHEKASYLSLCD